MKETPILFSQEMVCAYFDGSKGQTRRVAKNILPLFPHYVDLNAQSYADDHGQYRPIVDLSPYGGPGDRLWGRETWRPYSWGSDFDWMMIQYRAGGQNKQVDPGEMWRDKSDDVWKRITKECLMLANPQDEFGYFTVIKPLKWRPSIFLPRAAARILPVIKSVRLEMLQNISEEDAIAEGVGSIGEYRVLWDKINAKRGFGWDVNPPVWVVEFSRHSDDTQG